MNRRRKRNGLTNFEETLLNSRDCLLWPDCGCFNNLAHWQEALQDEDRIFSLEQLEYAEELLFYTCACVAAHCPDPKIKAYGARQWANLTARRQRIAQAQNQASAN
jgi:hypothetical protein